MTATTTPSRFLIVERPYYKTGEATFWLDEEDGPKAPREGDVVRAVTSFVDEDGDLEVTHNGLSYNIARAALVDVEHVLALLRTQGI